MRLAALVSVALLAVIPQAAAARLEVGPGPVRTVVPAGGGYSVSFRLTPNLATRTGSISIAVTRDGRPLTGARVRVTVRMLDMDMGSFALPLPEHAGGTYGRMFPVVGMGGRWGFELDVTPRHGHTFRVSLADRML